MVSVFKSQFIEMFLSQTVLKPLSVLVINVTLLLDIWYGTAVWPLQLLFEPYSDYHSD